MRRPLCACLALFLGANVEAAAAGGRQQQQQRRKLPPATTELYPELPPRGKLLWEDDFDGKVLNPKMWQIYVENPMVNEEQQSYQMANVYLKGGDLVLEGRPGGSTFGMPFSSGKISTQPAYDINYGHIEIRMKIAKGQGTWPSVFMLPEDWFYGEWPQSGEIDIFEAVNTAKNPHASMHYGGVFGQGVKGQNGCVMNNNLDYSLDYHLFTLSWTPGYIQWGIDGRVYCTCSTWFTESPLAAGNPDAPYDKRFTLIFNLALGGTWPGLTNALQAPFQMLVDYVRVYALTPEQAAATRTLFPGPVGKTPPNLVTPVPVAYNVEEEGGPFVPWHVPLSIDAESFDLGGEGVGYHDVTPLINSGDCQLRPYDGVDLGEGDYKFPVGGDKFGETAGAFVQDFTAGEWLSYTFQLTEPTLLNGSTWLASLGPENGHVIGLLDSDDCNAPLPANTLFEIMAMTPGPEKFEPFLWQSNIPVKAGVHRLVVCSINGGVNFTRVTVGTTKAQVQWCGDLICQTPLPPPPVV